MKANGDQPKLCPACQTPLRADLPNGVCPRCMVLRGLGVSDDSCPTLTESRPCPPEPPRAFGAYEIVEEIARGGMGVVYKARQVNLGRIVALKMILSGSFAGPQIAQRFKSEAIAAALLRHPNIVAVHEVGVHEGQHFFSMEYVPGQNLAQLIGNRPLPPARAAQYVRATAEAIHYAHEQGILHRDLKPSNVLIDSASDQPRVTDFGLAKRLDSDSTLTWTGQVLGSPNFMPPEQAGAGRGKAGRHTDVYGLGGILYYALTARPPFQADSLEAVLAQVIDVDPVAPRLLNPSIPMDLETICLKCLEKDPARRYRTAQEVAEELNRFLQNEPIRARPVGRAERAWRWCRRKPALAAALSALLCVFTAGLTGIVWQWRRAEQQLYVADLNRAHAEIERGETSRARERLERYVPKAGQPDLRGLEWRLLWPLTQSQSNRVLFKTNAELRAAVFSPDGRLLATGGEMNAIALVDVASGHLVRTLTDVPGRIDLRGLAFSPDGKLLAAVAGNTLRVWSTADWGEVCAPLPSQNNSGWMNCSVDFARDSSVVAARAPGNAVAVWSTTTWERLATIQGSKRFGSLISYSPNGRWLAVSDMDQLQIWHAQWLTLETNLVRGTPETMADLTRFISVAWSGDLLAAGCRDGALILWEVATWRELGRCKPVKNFLCALAFSPDGQLLAVAEERETIRIFDVSKLRGSITRSAVPRPMACVTGGASTFSLAFVPGGRGLMSAGTEGSVRFWPAWVPRPAQNLAGSTGVVGFTSDGEFMVCQDGASYRQWRVKDLKDMGKVGPTLTDPEHQPSAVSPGGTFLAFGLSTNVHLWDLRKNRLAKILPGSDPVEFPLTFSPSGRKLAVFRRLAGSPGQPSRLDVEIWDAEREKVVQRFHDTQSSVAFSPDEELLAIATRGAVELHDRLGRRHSLTVGSGRLHGLDFSPHGDLLAVHAPHRGQILLYRTSLGQLEATFPLNHGLSSSVFSKDGRTFISRDVDGSLTFWNMPTRQPIFTLPRLNTFAFVHISPNGNTLAFKSDADENPADEVELWTAPTFEEIAADRR